MEGANDARPPPDAMSGEGAESITIGLKPPPSSSPASLTPSSSLNKTQTAAQVAGGRTSDGSKPRFDVPAAGAESQVPSSSGAAKFSGGGQNNSDPETKPAFMQDAMEDVIKIPTPAELIDELRLQLPPFKKNSNPQQGQRRSLTNSTAPTNAPSPPPGIRGNALAPPMRSASPTHFGNGRPITRGGHNTSPTRRRGNPFKESLPGPGAYYNVNPRITHPQPPSFSFGFHLPPNTVNDSALTPGPGSYDPQLPKQGPRITIKGRERQLRRSETPGPGSYIRSKSPEGPAFSLGGRIQETRRVVSPGPGAYYHEVKPTGPSFSLLSRITSHQRSLTPGPGTYSPPTRPTSPSFSITSKPQDRKENEPAPGPGTYNLPHTVDGPSFSLLGKIQGMKRAETPGPGRYSLASRAESPSFSFGSRIADPKISQDMSRAPGPGTYETPKFPKSLSYSFGNRIRQRRKSNSPGPGAYHLESKSTGPSFSLLGRVKDGAQIYQVKNNRQSPGPGAYNVIPKHDGPAFSLHGRVRSGCWRSQTPGPGTYSSKSSCVYSAAPKYSLGQRLNSSLTLPETEMRPGPGTYNPVVPHDGPAFTIHSRF